jgi:hypothetical protein
VNLAWIAFPFVASTLPAPQVLPLQFGKAVTGMTVKISLDGSKIETTFAGKLGFRDATHSWQSVCADVRSPVSPGQFFNVNMLDSQKVGGNVAKAGNIVARWFGSAVTPVQCAALQIAVWKALEDGSDSPDFLSGRFQVQASPAVITYAEEYYSAINEPGTALYLQVQSGAGQGEAGQGDAQGLSSGQAAGGQGGGGQSQLTTP